MDELRLERRLRDCPPLVPLAVEDTERFVLLNETLDSITSRGTRFPSPKSVSPLGCLPDIHCCPAEPLAAGHLAGDPPPPPRSQRVQGALCAWETTRQSTLFQDFSILALRSQQAGRQGGGVLAVTTQWLQEAVKQHGKSVVFGVGRPICWLCHLWGRIFGASGPWDTPTLSASPRRVAPVD